MITASKMYKLAKDGVVIAEGSAKKMHSLRKKTPESKVWNAPSKKIGDKIGN